MTSSGTFQVPGGCLAALAMVLAMGTATIVAKAMEMGLPTFTPVAMVTHTGMVEKCFPLGAALPPAAGVENMSDLLWFLADASWLLSRTGCGDGFSFYGGDSLCDGTGHGNALGDTSGHGGYAPGVGYGSGSGNGTGYGYGYGNGDGVGYV